MFSTLINYVLRLGLIAIVSVFIWRFVEPKTQTMRILRAALLMLGLLIVLAIVRVVES